MTNLDQVFDGFIGNASVLEAIKVEIEGCRRRGVTMRHAILTGHPGTGKTMLTNKIADALEIPFININCGTLKGKTSLWDLLTGNPNGRIEMEEFYVNKQLVQRIEPVILFWDEAHMIPNRLQNEMLKPMLEKQIEDSVGYLIDASQVTFIFATTDPDMLLKPLRDRCEIQCQLERYSVEELAIIVSKFKVEDRINVEGQWKKQWFEIALGNEACYMLAERSRSTPRLALNLGRGYYNYLRTLADDPYEASSLADSVEHLEKFFSLQGIRAKGLKKKDLEYLQMLSESPKALGVATLAAQMEVSETEVREDIEPFLRHMRFISIGKGGREITRDGRSMLRECMAALAV